MPSNSAVAGLQRLPIELRNCVFCGCIGIANAVQKSLNSIFIEFMAAFIELHVYLSPSRASGSPVTPISPCCGTTGLGFSNKSSSSSSSSSSLRSRASPHSNCFVNTPRLLELFLLPPKELASIHKLLACFLFLCSKWPSSCNKDFSIHKIK